MSNNELDLNALNDAFDINYNDLPENVTLNPEDQFEEVEIDYDDPLSILKGNIKKANQILDKIQAEMIGGNFTARMVEVAGNIINGITAASKEIMGDKNYNQYLEIRKDLAKLKEREVVIKEKSGIRGGGTTNQNIIVTSREDLLKIMEGKQPKKLEKPMKQIPENTQERK